MIAASQVMSRLPGQMPRPLHVLTLTPFYPFQGDDAHGCFIAEPLPWIEKLGIVNTVIATQPFYRERVHPSISAPKAHWSRYFSLPSGFGLPSSGRLLFSSLLSRVRKLHRERPIDLVHAHGALPCGRAAELLSRKLNIPFVVTVHGLDAFFTKQVTGLAGEWCRRTCRSVYQSARSVVCISRRVEQEVMTGVSAKTTVIYNGVDTDVFTPSPIPDRAPVILSVGNLIPIKGHELLLRAFAAIHRIHPVIACEIIGDGPEQPRLTRLAHELGIAEKVRFLGRRSRAQVAEAMSQSLLFALPSRYEGLGCVYLEAMSCAQPVIACRRQGVEEIIEHGSNGWLIDPDDLSGMTEALSRLLQDTQLQRQIGIAARHTIEQRYTLAAQSALLAALYRESAA